MKLDWKLTALTIGLWIVLLPVFSIVHEYGHAFACSMQGNEYEVHLSLLLNYAQCLGTVEQPHSFYMAGGFASASLAFVLFAVTKPILTGYRKSIGIVLVVIGVTQFVNMVMETYFHDFYMNSGGIMTGVNTMGAMLMLFFLIQRHSENQPRRFKKREYADVPQSIFKRSITDIIKGRKPRPVRKYTEQTEELSTTPTLDLLEEDAYDNYEDGEEIGNHEGKIFSYEEEEK